MWSSRAHEITVKPWVLSMVLKSQRFNLSVIKFNILRKGIDPDWRPSKAWLLSGWGPKSTSWSLRSLLSPTAKNERVAGRFCCRKWANTGRNTCFFPALNISANSTSQISLHAWFKYSLLPIFWKRNQEISKFLIFMSSSHCALFLNADSAFLPPTKTQIWSLHPNFFLFKYIGLGGKNRCVSSQSFFIHVY